MCIKYNESYLPWNPLIFHDHPGNNGNSDLPIIMPMGRTGRDKYLDPDEAKLQNPHGLVDITYIVD
jgi:hypothetical protein